MKSHKIKTNLLGIADLTSEQLLKLLDLAAELVNENQSSYATKLAAKTIIMLFYENSTRTRASFSMAAYKLGANLLELSPQSSSEEKGETPFDTFLTLEAMQPDLFVVRHHKDGLVRELSQHLAIPIVNAGDGKNEHPSQTLLDLLTISLHCSPLKKLKISLVGDILHSRVARSFILAIHKLEMGEVCLVGPESLLPNEFGVDFKHVTIERDMDQGIKDADIIMMLRLQEERIKTPFKLQAKEYFALYGLSPHRLSLVKKDALIMHPGPFNRNIEICPTIAYSNRSLILKQVNYGVFARMAIFLSLLDEKYRQDIWHA